MTLFRTICQFVVLHAVMIVVRDRTVCHHTTLVKHVTDVVPTVATTRFNEQGQACYRAWVCAAFSTCIYAGGDYCATVSELQ